MLKRYIGLIILLILVRVTTYAQVGTQHYLKDQQITASSFYLYYVQYNGTPFFDSNWGVGSLTLSGGETYDSIKVRIDLYKGNVIYYNEYLHKQLVIDRDIVKELKFKTKESGDEYYIKNSCIDSSSQSSNCELFFVHYTDSISLWSKQVKKVEPYNNVSRSNHIIGEYYSVTKYYFVSGNTYIQIPKSKWKLANLFPENKREIRKFIHENRLKLNNSAHLIKIVKELNKL